MASNTMNTPQGYERERRAIRETRGTRPQSAQPMGTEALPVGEMQQTTEVIAP